MVIDKLFETLEGDVGVLRDAIQCGLYGTRSIVADQVLKIEHQISDIKRYLSEASTRPDNAEAIRCPDCGNPHCKDYMHLRF